MFASFQQLNNVKAAPRRARHMRGMDFRRELASYEALDDLGRGERIPRTRRRQLHSSGMLNVEDFSIRDEGVVSGFSPDFQLALPYQGLFSWDVGLGKTLVDANQLLFIASGRAFVEHQPIAAIGHSSIILTPRAEARAELFAQGRAGEEGIRTDVAIPASDEIRRLLQFWLGLRRTDDPGVLELDELAVATFQAAMRIVPHNRPFPSRLVLRAKEMLHEMVSEPLSLQQLAHALDVSPVYLTQTFSRAEGMPLYRYQLRLRLARAMVELPDADDITALALELGFSSHSHFTTAFKAFTSQTPSAFRESLRKTTRGAPGATRGQPARRWCQSDANSSLHAADRSLSARLS